MQGKTQVSLYTTPKQADEIAASMGWLVFNLEALAFAARSVH